MAGPGAHSPVGGSAAKRVVACPASVALATGIEDEESDHAAMGTAVHTLIEHCFRTDTSAWQHIGKPVFEGELSPADEPPLCEGAITVDRKMSINAQVMLDAVRKAHPERNQGNFGVERHFHCPDIHPLFFSTTDVWALENEMVPGERTLHIWDYKNGAGVIVEVEGNEQGMYYAAGALETFDLWDKVDKVVIHIVQPNAWHADGPVRQWETTPDVICAWVEDTLIPAMTAAVDLRGATPEQLAARAVSGEHCLFCPARLNACPALVKDMEELQQMVTMMEAPGAPPLTNEQLGRFIELLERAKIVGKAANQTAFNRMMAGVKIPGWKLVKGKANRTWKEGAETEAKAKFGDSAFTSPELKSPAQVDDLPLGTDFTAQWASKPDVGLTVASEKDRRAAVEPPPVQSLFTDVTQGGLAPTAPQPAPEASAEATPGTRVSKRRGGGRAPTPEALPPNVVAFQRSPAPAAV